MGTVLEVRDIIRNYSKKGDGARPSEDDIKVIRGLSLKVEKKRFFLELWGNLVAGKSTLLRVLGLLDRPTEGKVFFEDFDTEELWKDELADIRRRKIGFVFQDYYLMDSLTVRENMILPMILDKADSKEMQRRAEKYAAQFELTHLLEKKPTELSGGEKQRAAICRALINDPELILADEPTGNLDVETGFAITQLLHSISEAGSLVIMTTHNMQLLWEYPGRVYRCADHLITDVTEQYSVASSIEEK